MSEEQIIRHCSPTLAGLKTGNMFVSSYSDVSEMRAAIRHWNHRLTKKGLRILPLRYQDDRALIYIYRPHKLQYDLRNATATQLLCKCGYGTGTPEFCIAQLIKRMQDCNEFPHEIGLFLGYPPEDVCGFIENKAKGCKCVGCWKVYGDEKKAQDLFEKYKKCTAVYASQYTKGTSVERLAVAG